MCLLLFHSNGQDQKVFDDKLAGYLHFLLNNNIL